MSKARPVVALFAIGMMVLAGLWGTGRPATAHAGSMLCRYAPHQVLVVGTETDLAHLPDTWTRISAIELPGEGDATLIAAYALPVPTDVETALAVIEAYPRLSGDPNCYIGAAGWSIVGSGGWAPLPNVPATDFTSQPAFASSLGGIGLYDHHVRTLPETGRDITIGFVDGVDSSVLGGTSSTYTALFPGTGGAYAVAVTDFTMTLPLSFTVATSPTLPYMGSHGPFTVSVAQEIAPDATYRLYGVLNQNGVGTLYGALSAMNAFLNDPTVVPNRAVLNLSWEVASTKMTLSSLSGMIQSLTANGIVVVAAAGNGSAGTLQQPTGTPANLSQVIPAGATNGTGSIACYSNQAWLYAPGGDGVGSGCIPPTFSQCATSTVSCIVGYDPTSPTLYSYWAGTSYSTAMVSATSALMLQVEPALTPATLYTVLHQSVTTLGSILNVPDVVNLVR